MEQNSTEADLGVSLINQTQRLHRCAGLAVDKNSVSMDRVTIYVETLSGTCLLYSQSTLVAICSTY